MQNMNEANANAVSVLNGLIETCRDGQMGFETAAQGLEEVATQNLFEQYANQRAMMVQELKTEVQRLGGQPEKSGSVAGAAHRGWINIKAAVTGKDKASIIAEAERGEDVAKASFEKALQQEDLPSDVMRRVERMYEQVRAAHDRVRSLELATSH